MTTENQESTQTDSHAEKARLWASIDSEESSGATSAREGDAAASKAVEHDERRDEPAAASAQEAAHEAAPNKEAAQDDPYAGMTEAAKNELIGLKTMLQQATTRLRNAEGHIGGLNGQLRSMQEAAKAARAAGESTPSPRQMERAQGSPEAMKRLLDDYPEFGGAVKEVLEAKDAEVREELKSLRAQVPQAEAFSREDVEQLVTKAQSETFIEVQHRGWKRTVASPSFHGWLEQQPREVQSLAHSSDPEDAVRLLDLHKGTAGQAAQRNQRLQSAAALPTGRASPGARGKPIEQMNKQEYWAYLDSMDRASAR
jgi:hypothetical protein